MSYRPQHAPVIRVSATRSNSGKTTLIEQIIRMADSHGLRVATIKHTHHGFDLDREGKDSDRHRAAGADKTLLVGRDSAALLLHKKAPSNLDASVQMVCSDVDLVIAEGFKNQIADIDVHIDLDSPDRLKIDGYAIHIGTFVDQFSKQELNMLMNHLLTLICAERPV